jgi:hypothetical protein
MGDLLGGAEFHCAGCTRQCYLGLAFAAMSVRRALWGGVDVDFRTNMQDSRKEDLVYRIQGKLWV